MKQNVSRFVGLHMRYSIAFPMVDGTVMFLT